VYWAHAALLSLKFRLVDDYSALFTFSSRGIVAYTCNSLFFPLHTYVPLHATCKCQCNQSLPDSTIIKVLLTNQLKIDLIN
jgi:hypothetical protein